MVKWQKRPFKDMYFVLQRCSWVLCLYWDRCSFQLRGAVTSPSKLSPSQFACIFSCQFWANSPYLLPDVSLSQQRGPLPLCSSIDGRAGVIWINLTLERNRKTSPTKSLNGDTDGRSLWKQDSVCWVRGMCWGRYFSSPWGETGCPWWECAAVSREPGQADTGLATPGWAALCAPVQLAASSAAVQSLWWGLCLLPGKEVPESSSFLPHSHVFLSPHHQPGSHELELYPSPVSRKAGIAYFSSTLLSRELKNPGCLFIIPHFKSGLMCRTQAPRQLLWFSRVLKLRTKWRPSFHEECKRQEQTEEDHDWMQWFSEN